MGTGTGYASPPMAGTLRRSAPAAAAALAAGLFLLGGCRRAPAVGAPSPDRQPAADLAGASPPAPGEAAEACRRTGCSGEVCAEEERMTTCEWKAEYACYREARCERQPDGRCGWSRDDALARCLEERGPR